MDNIREKLLELLGKNARCPKEVSNCHDCPYWADDVGCYEDEATADMLIANNVTVQEWIPVSERLPNPFVSVLVQMPGEKPCPTVREGFITRDGIWHSALYDREPDEVTHWMPMPQPPKGE